MDFFKVVKEAFFKEKNLQTKSTYADLVTETDQAVEKQIIGSFREKYPSHKYDNLGIEFLTNLCVITNFDGDQLYIKLLMRG